MSKSLNSVCLILLFLGIGGVMWCCVNILLFKLGMVPEEDTKEKIIGLILSAVHAVIRIICGTFGVVIESRSRNEIIALVSGIALLIWNITALILHLVAESVIVGDVIILILAVWYLLAVFAWRREHKAA